MTALLGLDERPAGRSWTRQVANTSWPTFQSQKSTCAHVNTNCPLFRQKPSLMSYQCQRGHSWVLTCTLGWQGNCSGMWLVPWAKGRSLAEEKRSIHQPRTLEGHLSTLSLCLFIYPIVTQMILQQTVKEKVKWRQMLTLLCACTYKYMNTDVLHVYSCFTVIVKYFFILIKTVKMIKDIQGDIKLFKKMYKEV